MISLRNVHFAYEERPVLRAVSFELAENESLVVLGPSGSGKSTILRLILGLECPQRGEVIVDGENVCTMREKKKIEMRKKIGMVFQAGALFDSLTVGENVGYYLLEHTKLPWDDIEIRVREMLGFVGLNADEIIDQLPEELSGGMQRRVAIGRALLSTNPRIMLYDEPTTGLDPRSTEQVLELINKLNREKRTASIMVTHEIADAFAVANRFVIIHSGELVFDGTLADLRDSRDEKVLDFLAPFRESFAEVTRKQFI
jgi:phospholipid/cholesterol/gamma-HCH transport system ATP-binding protein